MLSKYKNWISVNFYFSSNGISTSLIFLSLYVALLILITLGSDVCVILFYFFTKEFIVSQEF